MGSGIAHRIGQLVEDETGEKLDGSGSDFSEKTLQAPLSPGDRQIYRGG